MKEDYYKILGLDKNASDSNKESLQKMRHKISSDKNPGDKKAEEKFKERHC